MLGRIILIGILFYIIYRIVRFFQRLGQTSPQKYQKRTQPGSKVMVKDEICNTYIPEDEALKEVKGGHTYYFCSEACRQKFIREEKWKH
ncbi:MAG: YHS domain-containing protein [Candidatus Saccharicenans sp.]|nr:YHS domain-containing protein [Candidatus Saccharicenans sp.]